ncbi:MAG: tripartite tricarboxylate transporter TctB family protein [candidate division NC10 bacterium]
MKRADTLTAFLLLAVALLVVWEGWRLGFGWSTDGPASGFFPFYLGLGLAICSIASLFQARAISPAKRFIESGKLAPVAKVALPAVAMVALTHVVGLYVCTAFYLALYMRWIGRHSWLLVVVLSLGIPFVTFLIFEKWFLVPLPKGPLETWLGY